MWSRRRQRQEVGQYYYCCIQSGRPFTLQGRSPTRKHQTGQIPYSTYIHTQIRGYNTYRIALIVGHERKDLFVFMFGFWEGGPSVYAWSDESNRYTYIYIYKYVQVFAVCLISRFLGRSCMVKFQDKHKYYLKSAEGTDIEKKKKTGSICVLRRICNTYVYNIMYTHYTPLHHNYPSHKNAYPPKPI